MKRNGFTLIEVLIVLIIIVILVAIVAGAYEDTAERIEQDEQESYAETLPDSKVLELRGRQHKEAMRVLSRDSDLKNTGNSNVELCHDGLVLVVITKDGKEYPPVYKENRYGDNERCVE